MTSTTACATAGSRNTFGKSRRTHVVTETILFGLAYASGSPRRGYLRIGSLVAMRATTQAQCQRAGGIRRFAASARDQRWNERNDANLKPISSAALQGRWGTSPRPTRTVGDKPPPYKDGGDKPPP